jgi:short-subunit dehydrogenase
VVNPFKDHVVILTGASRGIGEQLAYQLAGQGARLSLMARSVDALNTVADRCRALGGEALVVAGDLSIESASADLVKQTVAHYGRIDMLLYNAGMAWPGRFIEMGDLSTMHREMALNFFGLVACTHYALPHLIATKGRVVAVGSANSFFGMGGTIGYNSSKHALRGFLNTLRNEIHGTGVSVIGAYPGAVTSERYLRVMGSRAPKSAAVTPEECARQILLAAARRQRQHVFPLLIRISLILYTLFPALMDRQFAQVADWYAHE